MSDRERTVRPFWQSPIHTLISRQILVVVALLVIVFWLAIACLLAKACNYLVPFTLLAGIGPLIYLAVDYHWNVCAKAWTNASCSAIVVTG